MYEKTNLVSRHQGTLAVVLGCPHDGAETPVGVPECIGSPPHCPPFNKRDLHTREITTGVAQRLLDIFGEAPYVVIADYHRKYIDANRARECAYEIPAANEVPAAQQYYDEYHNTGVIDDDPAESVPRHWQREDCHPPIAG